MTSQIVILNGVGSVGKTSTARALQAITKEPFLHISMDMFLEMLPDRMMDHPDGLRLETSLDQGLPSVAITSGLVIQRVMAGMRRAIAAMAGQGNNLIVDEVMIDASNTNRLRQ